MRSNLSTTTPNWKMNQKMIKCLYSKLNLEKLLTKIISLQQKKQSDNNIFV